MTILLGATFALLLAAVVLSFNGMNDGVRNAPAEEIARLRSQLDQLRLEQDRLDLQRQIHQVQANPAPVPSPVTSEVDAMKAQLAAIEAEKDALQAEKDLAEKKADTYRDEAGFIGQIELEKNDNELRRARMIRDALLIGRITEYVVDADYGNFASMQIIMPEQVQVGTVLAIRRNTGILGQVEVTEVTSEGAIINPLPGFGNVDPQSGDELILPPQL